MHRTIRLALPCAVAALLMQPSSARADWQSWASILGASAWATSDCVPAGGTAICVDQDFGAATANANCLEVFPAPPAVAACRAVAFASAVAAARTAVGGGGARGGGSWGSVGLASAYQDSVDIAIDGDRTSSSTFRLSGSCFALNNQFREIAVFRYQGNLVDLHAAHPRSLAEVISQGFISGSDVLLHKTNDDIPGSFDYTGIDVTGIPDGQILVWAAAHGETVPAVPLASVVIYVLPLALLGIGILRLSTRIA